MTISLMQRTQENDTSDVRELMTHQLDSYVGLGSDADQADH